MTYPIKFILLSFVLVGVLAFSAPSVLIKDINKYKDDESVTLTGVLTRQLDDDEFIMQDRTGEIKIEIDKKIWYAFRNNNYEFSNSLYPPANREMTIRVVIDKDFIKPTEVEALEIISVK